MNINPTTLKDAGYRGPYSQPIHGDFCRGLYQKTVYGQAHGKVMKSYFLNVLIWEFPNRPLSASVDVVFSQEDGFLNNEFQVFGGSYFRDSPMVRQLNPTTGEIIYRREPITEKLLTRRVIQAVTNAWKGVAPIKESPRILH